MLVPNYALFGLFAPPLCFLPFYFYIADKTHGGFFDFAILGLS